MARQFLTGIDLAKNELLNARAQNLASHPSNPLNGLFYYNSTDNHLYYYSDGAWVDVADNGGEVFTTAMMNKLNDATNANTVSTLVMRDASGNFSAGTITATLTGNASTATKLATSRTLSISGDGTGSASFDGSANSTITLTLASVGTAGTYTKVTVDAKGRVTGSATLSASDIPTLTLSKISDAGTAASKNTGTSAGNIPVLDAGGKLDTGVLPAIAITDTYPVASQAEMLALTAQRGDVAIRSDIKTNFILSTDDPTVLANWLALAIPTDVVTSVAGKTGAVTLTKSDVGLGSVDNTADSAKAVLSATKLSTARSIALTGDVTGTVNFDGSANVSITTAYKNSGVTTGTYKSVTVDAKGNITAGTNPTTLSGYGITDATPSSHVGTGGASHANATTTAAGFQSAADKTKLDGIATGANAYTHPTGDGNSHVPATGTTNSGKVLKAGATANSASWSNVAYSELTGVPTNLTKKYSVAVGDGSATTIVVTHNLNSREVVFSLSESASPYSEVITDIQKTSVNTVTLFFVTAPSAGQYTLTVIG